MNEETYEALKKVLEHATKGGPNDAEFWDAVKQVESWIDEVAKEYKEDTHKCIECGKEIPDSGSGYCYECCEKV